jgi:hypothetical protein
MRYDLINSTDVQYAPLFLLTIDDGTQKFRVVNNNENVTSRGDVFTAYPFHLVLTNDDGERAPEVSVSFDNVSQDLIKILREVHAPIKVTIELIWSDAPDVVEKEISHLRLVSISYTDETINAKLSVIDTLSLRFSGITYSPVTYPGLF